MNAFKLSPKYSADEISKMQSECPDIGPVYQAFKKDPKNRPDKEEIHANSDATRFYFSDWNRLEMHNDILYRIWEAPNGVHRCDQLLVPRSFRDELCRNIHDSALGAHMAAHGRMVLVTAHRRENHGQGIRNLCLAILELADRFPTVRFVYPVHLNPNVRQPVHEILGSTPNVDLIEPASYSEFVWLMDRATLILSDSGGVQEEAPTLGKPVLVTRESTERPEALHAGATKLIGTDTERVVAEVSRLLIDKDAYAAMQTDQNPYGDGRAAERILDAVLVHAGQQTNERPVPVVR